MDSDLSQTSVYDCVGQRVQTTSNGVTSTMVYDIFGQQVADYNGTTMEKESIYRGGQVLAVYEAASTCYKTLADFVTAFYQGALHRNPNSTELSEWTLKLSKGQTQGQSKLIKVAQDLGTALFTSSEYTNTNHSTYVNDLYAAFLQRSPDSVGYNNWMATLAGGASFTTVSNGFAYSQEFQGNVVSLCPGTSSGTSTSANLKYVLTDVQGSGRALMNNSGSGTSTIVARHDYLPFGEEIWAGVGLRTTTQKYAVTDKVRQNFALTERDEATGLDHTWFRKYESFAGRWTSPDPYPGKIGNPQSFNRYAYVQNDPVNFVDPSGLDPQDPPPITHNDPATGRPVPVPGINAGVVTIGPTNHSGPLIGRTLIGGDAHEQLLVVLLHQLDADIFIGSDPTAFQDSLSAQEKQKVWNKVFKSCVARKERERKALIKKLGEDGAANLALGCILGGVVGAVSGAMGGGLIAGPFGAIAGVPAGVAIGFHEGCALGAISAGISDSIIGNMRELRKMPDESVLKQREAAACKVEADNMVSQL